MAKSLPISYPSRVAYAMTALDGSGKSSGQMRVGRIVRIDDETKVADLIVDVWPEDGYPADILAIAISDVPYAPIDTMKGAVCQPGLWFGI